MTEQEQLQELQETFLPEELHPDLKEYMYTTDGGIPFINHPLVQHMFHLDQMNRMINRQYLQKRERLSQAIIQKDYLTIIFLHERPFRLNAFVDFVYPHLEGREYWEILGSIWIDTMNSWQNHEIWKMLWNAPIPGRENCMDESEQKIYNNLPDKIIAYRGVGDKKNIHGFSWTLDIKIAEKFCKMYYMKGSIYRAEIDKKNVFAYFSGRNEDEIVVRPKTFRMKKMKFGEI